MTLAHHNPDECVTNIGIGGGYEHAVFHQSKTDDVCDLNGDRQHEFVDIQTQDVLKLSGTLALMDVNRMTSRRRRWESRRQQLAMPLLSVLPIRAFYIFSDAGSRNSGCPISIRRPSTAPSHKLNPDGAKTMMVEPCWNHPIS